MVLLVPVPEVKIFPGVLVNIQVPGVGNPFNTTPPVGTEHVGCVIVPSVGAAGIEGCAFTVTDVGDEMQLLSAVRLTTIG
jgi:hypothetical protein